MGSKSMIVLQHMRLGALGVVGFGLVLLAGVATESVAQPTGLPKDPADFSKAFSHDTHLALKVGDKAVECANCHTIDKKKVGADAKDSAICKEPRMPFPGHDACISCHPSSFFVQPLQICSNCHADISITKQSKMKDQGGAQAPLRTAFDHRLHLSNKKRVRDKFKFRADCTTCHSFIRGGEKVKLPEHAQCCECHTKKDVSPNIQDCAGCHKRPKSERNPRSKVRKFTHVDHKIDPVSSETLPCLRCHFEVPKAKKIAKLKLPKMATCVECHQGEIAFSYASCLKCHEKGIEAKLVPASHKAATKGK